MTIEEQKYIEAMAILEALYEDGGFYPTAIELTKLDGEELLERIKKALDKK